MEITGIKINRIPGEAGRLRAVASITFDDCLAVHDIKIIEGPERLFIAMPSKKVDTVYKDIVHPINSEMRKYIENTILEEYSKEN